MDAYGEALKPEVLKAFEQYGVLNERELTARYDVALEKYIKTINIEAQLMVLMARRRSCRRPPASRGSWPRPTRPKTAGVGIEGVEKALEEVVKLTDEGRPASPRFSTCWSTTGTATRSTTRRPSATRSCRPWRRSVRPATSSRRSSPHDLWPLPTYREMLFVK